MGGAKHKKYLQMLDLKLKRWLVSMAMLVITIIYAGALCSESLRYLSKAR